ncbi:MAG: hypothetical protein HUU49_01405 [Candidatus Buchananbacteria bacterium]|nr:hypothetical protein [Candidatus Buchananbacteria bacterium]
MKQGGLKQDQVFTNTIVLGVAIFFMVAGFFTADFTSEAFYITAILILFIFFLSKAKTETVLDKKGDIPLRLMKITLLLLGLVFIAAVVFLAIVIK